MFQNKVWFRSSATVFLLFMGACNSKPLVSSDPKQVLTEYISVSFSAKVPQDRNRLISFLTGETKQRMQNWSDDQFLLAFVENKRKFVKLAFKEIKSMSESEYLITYDLVYDTPTARVTHRKLAQLLKPQSEWLISDVKNIKEVVEYRNELSFP